MDAADSENKKYKNLRRIEKMIIPNNKNEWAEECRNLLKAEIARHGITNEELVKSLASIGVKETVQNVRNKINRGTFSAIFLIQVLHAINAKTLRFAD
jgi:hypothetical protein